MAELDPGTGVESVRQGSGSGVPVGKRPLSPTGPKPNLPWCFLPDQGRGAWIPLWPGMVRGSTALRTFLSVVDTEAAASVWDNLAVGVEG